VTAREANVLGALAQAIADRTASAIAAAAGQNVSSAAALSALHQFLDRPTVDRLRDVLGLTHSGAVRLVDRLTEAGLVTRRPGDDKRSRSVALTAEGRAVAERVAAARAAVLEELLVDLSPAERDTLGGLLDRLMAGVVRAKDGGAWICRLCDLVACERSEGRCPAANAAAEKYGVVPPD
jgi:DNA-binding MarR family transcriptional regulator